MRIGFFSDSYLPTMDGISFSIESYRRELEEQGHEVFVFAPAPGFRYKEKAPNIIRFPAVKGLFYDDYMTSVFFPPQALQKVKQYKLDIIHFHTPSQIGLLGAYFALRNKVPLVTTYHTDLYEYVTHYRSVLPGTIALSLLTPLITQGGLEDFRSALSGIKPERSIDAWNRKMVVRGMTRLHNYCDRVIAPSVKIEKQLMSWGTKSGVRVLPTGVDKITTTPQAKDAFRRKYGLSRDDQVVIFVGRLGSEKNIDLLINAFSLIAPKNPRAKLMIVGEHDYRKKLEQRVAKHNLQERVIFTGYIDHYKLGAAYESSKIFAFPSRTDTQGLVVHEAANSGLPVVMIDRQVTEVVIDGVNGYFARNSARDFANKLERILSNDELHQAMSDASRMLAEKYSARHQTQKLVHLYENILSGYQHAKQKPKRRLRLPGI
jgi:glycosyltransferase involved in cell wall biosynthesis